MEDYLRRLNENQREAVMTTDGPLLVLAGAGSGKTTVLSSRVAYILQTTYAAPWNILAITFTNKAANEMRERIESIINDDAQKMWIGTFHSVCARILRTCIDREGYGSDFVIYDKADSQTLIKECIKELEFDIHALAPRRVAAEISKAKNELITPEMFAEHTDGQKYLECVAEIYASYQKKLKNYNAVDFDDLIMMTVKILRENEDVAEKYQRQFKYILVDEYQDTNDMQYGLIGILARGYGNICVVGDDDQSIYKFRGANVNNILDFPKDYPDARVVKLERNYRSTKTIIGAANSVIANNLRRMDKVMNTDKGDGEKIGMYIAKNEFDEADFIARRIRKYHADGGDYSDCAVLYRTNAQSQPLEKSFKEYDIPYVILSGQRFYDRKEIKDVVAYLRVIYNPNDSLSLMRIINEPKRKIGTATINKVSEHAVRDGVSCYDVLSHVDSYSDLRAAAPRLNKFVALIRNLRAAAGKEDVFTLTRRMLGESGYISALRLEDTVESHSRLDNIDVFLGSVKAFSENPEKDGSLGTFLEDTSLLTDADEVGADDEVKSRVSMMTIHSAKGLEFSTVFLTGLDDEFLPAHDKYSETKAEDMEEERRLCYVAITRAKEKLYMTRAFSRFKRGYRMPLEESQFLREIPDEYMDNMSLFPARVMNTLESKNLLPKQHAKRETKKSEPRAAMPTFRVGERVHHTKYGEGTIKTVLAFGSEAMMTVMFDKAGKKVIMSPFTKVERI